MKRGHNVYGGTRLCPPEYEPGLTPRGRVSPEKHAFLGVIFKNYLVSELFSDYEIACGFGKFRAISKTSRARFLNFDLVLDL